jgi:2-iminobutanoate/2-iminopropanoate deaminase
LTREVVIAKEAAAPIGPYSQAIKVNGLVFFSGQSGGTAGSIEEQTARALDSLKAIAQAAGIGMGDIVSTTVYLKDVDDFARMNAVYAGYFKDKPPARATVQVARLPRDSLIQISAIAAK